MPNSAATEGKYLTGGKEFLLTEILLCDKLLQFMLKELLEVDVRLRPFESLLAVLRHEDLSVLYKYMSGRRDSAEHTPPWRLRTCPCGSQ